MGLLLHQTMENEVMALLIFHLCAILRWVVNTTLPSTYSREITPGAHWTGSSVGPTTGLDFLEKR